VNVSMLDSEDSQHISTNGGAMKDLAKVPSGASDASKSADGNSPKAVIYAQAAYEMQRRGASQGALSDSERSGKSGSSSEGKKMVSPTSRRTDDGARSVGQRTVRSSRKDRSVISSQRSMPSGSKSPKVEKSKSSGGGRTRKSGAGGVRERDEDGAIVPGNVRSTNSADDEASDEKAHASEAGSSSSGPYPDLEPLPGDVRPSIVSVTTDGRMHSPSHASTQEDTLSRGEDAAQEDEASSGGRGGRQPCMYTLSPFTVDSDKAYQIRLLGGRKKTVDLSRKSKYTRNLHAECRSARTSAVSSRSSQPSVQPSTKRPSDISSTRREEVTTEAALVEGQEAPYAPELRTVILSCDNIRVPRQVMWPPSCMQEVFDFCESTFEFLESGKYEVECHHGRPSGKNPWKVNEGEKQITLEIYFDTNNGIASLFELVMHFEIHQLLKLFEDSMRESNMELLKAALIEFVRRFSDEGSDDDDDEPVATPVEKTQLLDSLIAHIKELVGIPERLFTDVLQTVYAALENLKDEEHDSIDMDQFFALCLRGFTIRKNSPFHANIFLSSCDLMLLLCTAGGDPEPVVEGPAFDAILEECTGFDSANLAYGATACEALACLMATCIQTGRSCLVRRTQANSSLTMLARKKRGLEKILEKREDIIHWLVETLVLLEIPRPEASEWVVPALQVALFRLWGIMAFSDKDCRTAFIKHLEVPRQNIATLLIVDVNQEEGEQEEADVIAAACNAIAATLMDEDSKKHINKDFQQSLFSMLETYGADMDVLDNACRCLSITADKSFLQKKSERIVTLIMRHMKRYEDRLNFVTNALHTLGTIFRRDPSALYLCTEEILQEFVRILKEHPFNEELQEIGMYLLGTCATDNEKNRQNLIKAGAQQLCKLAIGQFPDNEDLQEQANHTYTTLSKESGWRFW